jgi:hypothetical protein
VDLGLTEDEMKRWMLFRPQYFRRFVDVLGKRMPMVHYTSAAAAMSIITRKKIWLRNAAFMNDASEIAYGMNLLADYFRRDNPARQTFWQTVDLHTKGRSEELTKLYDDWRHDLSSSTFVCCISEHDVERENEFGRLSMWRAYGRAENVHGVALVVNSAYLAATMEGLAAYSYPIEYPRPHEANDLFSELEKNFLGNQEYISSMSPEDVYGELFTALQNFCLTMKHPGFSEEREWRVIYRPNAEASEVIKPYTATIGGAPQRVFELPLEADANRGMALDLSTLVDRVIIGPSSQAVAMWRAFVDALAEAGVANADKKVICSGLPLR